uniref:Uncharacterized protein n=1 Tax=Rousettus aegyptiacus TaxID=9407 RepID=A0A7J8C2U8_ROUAE|nr:hypothetical protein HJG63_009481 [Rousettus aegyptiacus]
MKKKKKDNMENIVKFLRERPQTIIKDLILSYDGKKQETSLRIQSSLLQQLQVCEVLVRVGVEEALGVVARVRQDTVHLLVEVAALVGHVHGHAVAVHGVDDAARGDLGLQQADAVVPDDQVLLHGLEERDLLPGVGVGVAGDGALGRQQLLPDLAAHHARGHRLLHGQLPVAHGVDDEARGGLGLQQHQGRAGPQDALPHGLVDAHLLLPPGPVLGGHQHAGDAARALQVAPDRLHLRHLLQGPGALGQAPQGLGVQDPGRAQLGRGHLSPQAPEGHLAQPLLRLLDELDEDGHEAGQGQAAGRVLGQELVAAGLAQVGGAQDVPHRHRLPPEPADVHLHGGGTQGLLLEAPGGLGVRLAVAAPERVALLRAGRGGPLGHLGHLGHLGLLDDGGQPAGQRGQAQLPRTELCQQLLPPGGAHVAGCQHVPHGHRRAPQAAHLDLHGGGTQGALRFPGRGPRAPWLVPGQQRSERVAHLPRGQRARPGTGPAGPAAGSRTPPGGRAAPTRRRSGLGGRRPPASRAGPAGPRAAPGSAGTRRSPRWPAAAGTAPCRGHARSAPAAAGT